MIWERRLLVKEMHQVTSQPQQKHPHLKKNSSTPKVTPILKFQKLPRCQNSKMMMMMKLFWTLLYYQRHLPQKTQSPSQRNPRSKSSCASTTYKYSINIFSLTFNGLKAICTLSYFVFVIVVSETLLVYKKKKKKKKKEKKNPSFGLGKNQKLCHNCPTIYLFSWEREGNSYISTLLKL